MSQQGIDRLRAELERVTNLNKDQAADLLMVADAVARLTATLSDVTAKLGEARTELLKLKEENANLRFERDALLEITWLDGPSEPWESKARWREQFEKGWIRRIEVQKPETP